MFIRLRPDHFGTRKMFSASKYLEGFNRTISMDNEHTSLMFPRTQGLLQDHVCSSDGAHMILEKASSRRNH